MGEIRKSFWLFIFIILLLGCTYTFSPTKTPYSHFNNSNDYLSFIYKKTQYDVFLKKLHSTNIHHGDNYFFLAYKNKKFIGMKRARTDKKYNIENIEEFVKDINMWSQKEKIKYRGQTEATISSIIAYSPIIAMAIPVGIAVLPFIIVKNLTKKNTSIKHLQKIRKRCENFKKRFSANDRYFYLYDKREKILQELGRPTKIQNGIYYYFDFLAIGFKENKVDRYLISASFGCDYNL